MDLLLVVTTGIVALITLAYGVELFRHAARSSRDVITELIADASVAAKERRMMVIPDAEMDDAVHRIEGVFLPLARNARSESELVSVQHRLNDMIERLVDVVSSDVFGRRLEVMRSKIFMETTDEEELIRSLLNIGALGDKSDSQFVTEVAKREGLNERVRLAAEDAARMLSAN